MNDTTPAIAFFAKTPELSAVKTRLATTIGNEKARDIYTASLACIKDLATTLNAHNITPYWALAEENAITHPRWHNEHNTLYTGEGDLGTRQFNIYDRLISAHPMAILCGTDNPQLAPAHITTVIEACQRVDFALIGATDGGYVMLGGKKRIPCDIFTRVPYSTSDTRSHMMTALQTLGTVTELPALTDIDTYDDLKALQSEWPEHPTQAQSNLITLINQVLNNNQKPNTF